MYVCVYVCIVFSISNQRIFWEKKRLHMGWGVRRSTGVSRGQALRGGLRTLVFKKLKLYHKSPKQLHNFLHTKCFLNHTIMLLYLIYWSSWYRDTLPMTNVQCIFGILEFCLFRWGVNNTIATSLFELIVNDLGGVLCKELGYELAKRARCRVWWKSG